MDKVQVEFDGKELGSLLEELYSDGKQAESPCNCPECGYTLSADGTCSDFYCILCGTELAEATATDVLTERGIISGSISGTVKSMLGARAKIGRRLQNEKVEKLQRLKGFTQLDPSEDTERF
jgi:hypothetical protein